MIALSFRYPHHGEYSSYHRLMAYLGEGDRAVDATTPAWTYQRYFNPRGITLKAWRRHKERVAWKLAGRTGQEWLHYLYPEQSYFEGARLNPGGIRTALSCHLPKDAVDRAGERGRLLKEGLRTADALIVMSPDYVDYYQSLAPQARVAFIPHGIDVHYFTPAEGDRTPADDGPQAILVVGTMLRDFETLREVIELAAAAGRNWVFKVVAARDRLTALADRLSEAGADRFEPLCGISNEHLRRLYQESRLLFLPLLDATANNAVVEAMACGLPMLLTDFPATRAYAGEVADYVEKGNPEAALDQLDGLLGEPVRLAERGARCRERAVDSLSWEAIVARHREFLGEAP